VPTPQSDEIIDALKYSAAALRDAGIPFALAGGLAAWARGGPPTEHDIDFMIRPADAAGALEALAAAGMRTERPPEGWLVKAWYKDILIDLIYGPLGITVDEEFFAACEWLNVEAISMLVMTLEDFLVSKLAVLDEHNLDFGPLLETARSLRERIDWRVVRERTSSSPFARTFFFLLCELGVAETRPIGPNR
jgi:hypothetical protein